MHIISFLPTVPCPVMPMPLSKVRIPACSGCPNSCPDLRGLPLSLTCIPGIMGAIHMGVFMSSMEEQRVLLGRVPGWIAGPAAVWGRRTGKIPSGHTARGSQGGGSFFGAVQLQTQPYGVPAGRLTLTGRGSCPAFDRRFPAPPYFSCTQSPAFGQRDWAGRLIVEVCHEPGCPSGAY